MHIAAMRFPNARDTAEKRAAWRTRRKLIHHKARNGSGFTGAALFLMPDGELAEGQFWETPEHWQQFQRTQGGRDLHTNLRQDWKGYEMLEELPSTAQYLEGDPYPITPSPAKGLDESAQPGMAA
jgi:hypothetical protein